MHEFVQYLSGLEVGTIVTFFGLIVSAVFITMMTVILYKSLKGRDVTQLMVDPATDKFSHHKFWTNIAYLLASIAFIRFNFAPDQSQYIVEIWLVFLTVIGGTDVFSAFMKYKTRAKEMESNQSYYDDSRYGRYERPMEYNRRYDENEDSGYTPTGVNEFEQKERE